VMSQGRRVTSPETSICSDEPTRRLRTDSVGIWSIVKVPCSSKLTYLGREGSFKARGIRCSAGDDLKSSSLLALYPFIF
jgi:hypothetical protein